VTPTTSPTFAPSRYTSADSSSAQPTTVTLIVSAGALVTSPPATAVPVCVASAIIASPSSSVASSPRPGGTPSAT
jgi:hypothetical protein